MHVEAGIGETDEPFVKSFLVGPALVPTREKDRLPIRVEGEGDAPPLTRGRTRRKRVPSSSRWGLWR